MGWQGAAAIIVVIVAVGYLGVTLVRAFRSGHSSGCGRCESKKPAKGTELRRREIINLNTSNTDADADRR